MPKIGTTDLDVFDLCLGGNVFGWTADTEQSFAVLDAYAAAGGNFIDTSDSYMWRIEGNSGGESETIIGEWLASRGNRDQMVIATKVGSWPQRRGLGAANIAAALHDSLRRLRTDRIDLYYAHKDDPATPQEETAVAFDELVRAGKVRYLAASNFDADRLAAALAISRREGLAGYVALQPHYNLLERDFETEQAGLLAREGLACVPYHALASGFLSGKYRPGASGATSTADSPRAERARAYLDERGVRLLGVLDEVAAAHDSTVSAVALAWLAAQPTVVAPIASARSTGQLAELLPMAGLRLSDAELRALTDVR